jgi:hypothetical protein
LSDAVSARLGTDGQGAAWSDSSFKDRFGLPEKEFDHLYASYAMTLSTSDKTSNWNDDIEAMLREEGFINGMIKEGKHDLRTAVLQRIFLRLSIDESSGAIRPRQPRIRGTRSNGPLSCRARGGTPRRGPCWNRSPRPGTPWHSTAWG